MITILNFNLLLLPEQAKIANFLTSLDKRISQVSAQIEYQERYKRGLLQRMFV